MRQAGEGSGNGKTLDVDAYLMAIAKSGESLEEIPEEDVERLKKHNQSSRSARNRFESGQRPNVQADVNASHFEALARLSIATEVLERFEPYIKELVGKAIVNACRNDSAVASALGKLENHIMRAVICELTGVFVCDAIVPEMLRAHLSKLGSGETMKVFGSRAMGHTWVESGNIMDDAWAGMSIFTKHSRLRTPVQIRSYLPRTLQYAAFAPELASLDRSHAAPLAAVFDEVGAALAKHEKIQELIKQKKDEFSALSPEQREDPERWKHLPQPWVAPDVFSAAFRKQGIEKADADPESVTSVIDEAGTPAPAELVERKIRLGEEVLATHAARKAGKPLIHATDEAQEIAARAKRL